MSVYIKENPRYLTQSIESILSQTTLADQIIIVKDGPLTNKLEEVIDGFLKKYEAIFTIVDLKENLGLGLALNEGIKASKNELIARMDTDDIAYFNRMEIQLEEFKQNPELDIIGTLTSEFYNSIDEVVSSRIVPEKHDDIVKFSKRRSPFNHPTVMYRKSALESVGGYRNILRNEDLDLFARMLNKGFKAKNIQIPLLYFRSNKDNYKRRKSWENCINYIKVILNFWKNGYSTTSDLIYVTITQIGMFIAPSWLLKKISDKFLRQKQ